MLGKDERRPREYVWHDWERRGGEERCWMTGLGLIVGRISLITLGVQVR
jgi:hypothetical protein